MRRFVLGLLASYAVSGVPLAAAITLEDAIQAAEGSSVDLALLEQQTRATAAIRGQAWSLLSPKVQAQGSYTINEYPIVLDTSKMIPPEFAEFVTETEPITVQEKQYLQGAVTVQQPLFSGEAMPLLLGAYRTVDAARFDEASARQLVRAGVAKSYYGLMTAREAVALAESAEATAKAQLDLAKRYVDAGTAPPRAVLQAELGLSQATREVQGAIEQRVAAEEAFHRLTGLPRDVELDPPAPPEVPASVEAALETARVQRPDLLAAEQRAKAARLQRSANLAGFLPDVNARYTWAYTENTGFSDDPTIWMLVFEGTWLLWDGGYRAAKADEYGAQVHMAELAALRSLQEAEATIRTQWERYHRAEAALVAVEREQALAAENLRLARLGFEAGTVTWLEVEQAELGDRAARLNALIERMNRDLAAIDLRVAMGDY